MEIELIGVPFDGYGRPGNQASAPTALREAGLAAAFGTHQVNDAGDLALPPPNPERGSATSLINEAALLAMAEGVGGRVAQAMDGGRWPLLVGGDCTCLLGVVPALRDILGGAGLVFVDGHEDTMPLDVSEDGEAANTEIGLLLGLTGQLVSGPLRHRLATLEHDALAMLGQRDERWRRQFNVGSLREHGVWLRNADEVAADPRRAAREAVQHVSRAVERWWLHVDLDVLDPTEFAAQGLSDVEDEPGGLSVAQLTELLVTAADTGGCAGLSLVIYDPDQDPHRRDAHQLIELAAATVAAWS